MNIAFSDMMAEVVYLRARVKELEEKLKIARDSLEEIVNRKYPSTKGHSRTANAALAAIGKESKK